MNKCWDCEFLDRNNVNKDWFTGKETYYCKEKRCYKKIDDDICGYFKGFRDTGSYKPSGCYITTIVCELLGLDDNCEELNTLRNFRDNYLKNNENLSKYIPLLLEYDTVGVEISNVLRSIDKDSAIRMANETYSYYLIPCINAINNKLYSEAIAIYINMITRLKDVLSLSGYSIATDTTAYDYDTLGKGRIKKLEK